MPFLGHRAVRAALFLAFFALYLATGRSLGRTGVFDHDDALFQSDTSRAARDLTEPGADHYRTKVHPLFVILFNPAGTLLCKATDSPYLAAALLVSAAGALCVVAAHVFFTAIGHGPVAALTLSCLLGVSASHLLFASIPDTFIFTALSFVVCACLALRRPGSLKAGVPAVAFALGMATTNIAPSSLLFFGGARKETGFWKSVGRSAALVLLALTIAAGLSLLQKAIYPSSNLFFARESFREDVEYVFHPKNAKQARIRKLVLLRHLAVFDVVAPEIQDRTPKGSPVPWVTFHKATLSDIHGAGRAAVILLLALDLLALYGILRRRLFLEPVLQSLILGILFLATLHYYYGDDLFLYSCSWLFLVLAVMAWGLQGFAQAGPRWTQAVNGLLIGLLILTAVNNLAFLRSLAGLYLL
ncbi:MAG TPA: hypothetical protein VH394_19360 [Thermoanaerobaculia bacterium]|jgi:hypothetical protein|nr:hypothetical protein [Thermoanaerobaculia bacterium]